MKEFISDHKIQILAALVLVAALGFGVYKLTEGSSSTGETAYVATVEKKSRAA